MICTRKTCSTAALLLLGVLLASAQDEEKPADPPDDDVDAIIIKLNPLENRKMTDLRPLVKRFKSLPELLGASLVPVPPDMLILVPKYKHSSFEQVRQVLLQQPEVYELEVGEKSYRRGGDMPYDQLRKKKLAEVLTTTRSRIQERMHQKLREVVHSMREGGANAAAMWGKATKRGAPLPAKRAARRARRVKRRAARSEDADAAQAGEL